jgi:hypothetical protein
VLRDGVGREWVRRCVLTLEVPYAYSSTYLGETFNRHLENCFWEQLRRRPFDGFIVKCVQDVVLAGSESVIQASRG